MTPAARLRLVKWRVALSPRNRPEAAERARRIMAAADEVLPDELYAGCGAVAALLDSLGGESDPDARRAAP